MKVQITKCDGCGIDGALTYKIGTGGNPAPSGNECACEEIDLCVKCAGVLLDADRCMDVKKGGKSGYAVFV